MRLFEIDRCMDGHERVADVAVCKMCTCHPYGDALNGADISTRRKVIKYVRTILQVG